MKLSHLFASGRDDSALVSFGREERRFADFARDVDALAGAVQQEGGGPWILFSEDSYAFSVGLFGLARAGASALLPPNPQPGSLRRLAPESRGAIVDAGIEIPDLRALAPLGHPTSDRPAAPLDSDAPFVHLFTSGTTGAGKLVTKSLRHFETEIEVLERSFGNAMGDATPIVATVSHHHMYGLLLRVLWPLSCGRPFDAGTPLHAAELRQRAEAAFVLVSSPAQLRRLSTEIPPQCRTVFSSGAPLPGETARNVKSHLGASPFEIFGSTETGGVAWRQQTEDERWTPFPGVHLESLDGQLTVTSPFVSVPQPFTMGDRIEFEGERFRLLGRADRVVKIGEKRLSLPDMEAALETHPQVAEAALVDVRQGEEGRVGAVLVLTEAGRETLAAEGRRAVAKALGEHLAPDWDRVLLPRAWRYLDELPRNAQGKLVASELRDLFTTGPILEPERLGESRTGNSLERRCRVPEELAFLEGHFEGFPIVAGVVQVHWAMQAIRTLAGETATPQSIEALKFHRVLCPGDLFTLRIEASSSRGRFSFELADGERVFSRGRVVLGGRQQLGDHGGGECDR